jgi:hypothetical protein
MKMHLTTMMEYNSDWFIKGMIGMIISNEGNNLSVVNLETFDFYSSKIQSGNFLIYLIKKNVLKIDKIQVLSCAFINLIFDEQQDFIWIQREIENGDYKRLFDLNTISSPLLAFENNQISITIWIIKDTLSKISTLGVLGINNTYLLDNILLEKSHSVVFSSVVVLVSGNHLRGFILEC